MPKISDILGGLERSNKNECRTLIQVANILRCSSTEVRRKFDKNGPGMIYTRGLIMSDTPRHRAKLTEMYGEIVVLFADDTVYCRTRANIGQINRHERKIKWQREAGLRQRERDERKKEAATKALFKSCQGKSCPKRQGKANSHEDIGKFKSSRSTYHENFQPRYTDVFVTIHIPGLN